MRARAALKPCLVIITRARVLLVEDDLLWQKKARALLEARGLDVLIVQSGEEAIVALAQPEIIAMVLDLGLPTMTGMATLRAAREHRPELPIVIFTSYADPLIVDAALRRGACAVVCKEKASTQLAHAVQTALTG